MVNLDFPATPEEYVELLESAGMPTERARVWAYTEHGYSNTEIADELSKSKSTVTGHHNAALEQQSDARKLTHYMYNPAYLSELPNGAGVRLDEEIEHTIAFRLHRPRLADTSDAEYTLENCEVVEGFYIDDDAYLIKYHNPGTRNLGETTYFTIESQFLVRFIHDWVVPVRQPKLRRGRDSHLAGQYFLTDAFEPEWLENELAEVGIERVEVLTDDRFTNPLDEEVEVSDAAPTGRYHSGYRVGYSPTDLEIAQLLKTGEITDDQAESITRMRPESLRELVSE